MARKIPESAVIVNRKSNSMQNKPLNEGKGKDIFVDFDMKLSTVKVVFHLFLFCLKVLWENYYII